MENVTQYNHFFPMVRNGWIVKFSVCNITSTDNPHILIFITSRYTGQTLIRYFDKETNAVEYINKIIQKDSTQIELALYTSRSMIFFKPKHP